MKSSRRLWQWLGVVFLLSFAALGWIGREIYLAAPPVPERVVSEDGQEVFGPGMVMDGQVAWMSAGGQQLGSVWGHGSYLAPDWSADWLHREALGLRDAIAQSLQGKPFDALDADGQAVVSARVKAEMRRNTYDPASGAIILSKERTGVVRTLAAYYSGLFGNEPALDGLREQYAMVRHTLKDPAELQALPAFFFWTAWSAAADRPGQENISYTSNWPHEPLVGNAPTTGNGIWSMVSIVLLIAGIAVMVLVHAAQPEDGEAKVPESDPLFSLKPTPSMRATAKYFYIVIALLLLQIGMGVVTAHYAVEGQTFFGLPLAELLPYVSSRTIHTQLGVLWIATAWLATGLYISPALAGQEPRFQRLGVNVLFYALVLIVVGSLICGWVGTQQRLGSSFAFWLGNQGLEYTSMGRIWQYGLFAGLLIWLGLMARALWPALKRPSESRGLIAMVFLSAACIGAFYASSLMWGQRSHYSMIEYWRWWLVHLWVEGFFEVFATAVIALIFARLGLIRTATANAAIVMETIVFLFGGILGTLHHLYFTGTPTSVIAIGAVFSALEVVPLALVGFEGWRTYRRTRAAPWVQHYRWIILCFVAVGFWNTVGAGLLGFAINPPISLYYVQGLNTTPAHGHAALFGVYGMLGIGLLLFCLRGLMPREHWQDKWLRIMFWALNVGLAMMVFMSLLPAGIYQAWASVSEGLWYARSVEVVQSEVMRALVWLRVPGDVVFGLGALALAWFALRLLKPSK
ncbi:MAG: nitric oxide reductase large subunit [Candidatus Dactylopiibacterium carminicum]|uniref:Nitric-oxide reductase large subunit n=1 Tax=Candidatus Dactylopiibacterium carminicum TaxID=857335 RepID=A0A272EQ77_9RHOO|nr:nitric-oxide reductase large subunit [Candidatus Dactylopiibacterium carminicum]KAF7598530.1 nitric-oxide reductase large subunit [Candidatus Dactylopiibacterium carminicum]PAS92264.1 MAG: nitric oxide reductase large subunit [Candidatus Dactylopiibacterium carminicum]PAS98015.1 MAG: nitric oxide reductase large subunit [Candidatus Dactylopiibacterium carminicum]